MKTIISSLKVKLFLAIQFLLGICLSFRCSALGLLVCFRNVGFIWVLPILLLADIFINSILKTYVNHSTLTSLLGAISQNSCETIDADPFIDQVLREISRYELFKGGNTTGTKKVTFLRSSDNKASCYVSFPIFDNVSYVLVPQSTNLEDQKQRVILTHEAAHCISDDLSTILEYDIKLFCILIAIFSVFTLGVDLKLLLALALAGCLYKVQNWREFYSEIVSNNLTIEILEAIPDKIAREVSARILQRPKKMELSLKYANLKFSISNKISEIKLKLQVDYLETVIQTGSLIEYSSPINLPMILMIAAPVLLANSADHYLLIANFSFHWSFLIISLFILVVMLIVTNLFQKKEKEKRWKIQSCIGKQSS